MSDRLSTPDEVVVWLQGAVADGDEQQDRIARFARRVIDDEGWRAFRDETGVLHENGSFLEFVTRPRWDGLGTTREEFVGWIRFSDPETADRVDALLKGEIPAANRNGANQYGGSRGTRPITSDTSDTILARLKRDDPDTAQKVITGELSANAAAHAKGWRKPRIVLSSPESVATRIRDHFTQDEIESLITLLKG